MEKVSLEDNINTIRETAPGRFRIILDFATIRIVKFLLRDDYKFVWINNYSPDNHSDWKEYDLPIVANKINRRALGRNVRFDFIIETSDFIEILPELNNGIELIQMNKIPPAYFDLNRIKGNKRYQLLRDECDFLFEVDIPSATDYGVLISNDRDYLQSLLDDPNLNWDDLP